MKVVDELWAFISVNHLLQEEGIIATKTTQGYQPYVFSSQESMMRMLPEAQDFATMKGVTILVKRFAKPVVVQTIHPDRH